MIELGGGTVAMAKRVLVGIGASAAIAFGACAASAQVPTEVLFFNYSNQPVLMNMNGEVQREIRAGGSDSHTSYFSKGFAESGNRVYQLRLISLSGVTLCNTYIRLHATSTKTVSECAVQSQESAPGVRCQSSNTIEGISKCRAQLSVDD